MIRDKFIEAFFDKYKDYLKESTSEEDFQKRVEEALALGKEEQSSWVAEFMGQPKINEMLEQHLARKLAEKMGLVIPITEIKVEIGFFEHLLHCLEQQHHMKEMTGREQQQWNQVIAKAIADGIAIISEAKANSL